MVQTQEILYSQLDITEGFDVNKGIGPSDWVRTEPLNQMMEDPETAGLPSRTAEDKEVHEIASSLSAIRESINIPEDGVYCPVCHIANVNLALLRQPCPQCKRELLKFGWD